MALIRIRIAHADAVIARMEALLWRRKCHRVTRKVFLVAWGRLRRELSATPEYQDFRQRVYERDRGSCSRCGAPTRVVDHRVRVAVVPRKAVSLSNGRLMCPECHAARHKCLRIAS